MTRSMSITPARIALVASLALLGACRTAPEPAVTPSTSTVTLSRTTSRGTAAEDENVRMDRRENEKDATAPAEVVNPHETTRGGAYCEVHFLNYTGYYLDLYVDGSYVGTVSPGRNWLTSAYAGPTRAYARARFNDGSYLSWGPYVGGCPAGSHQDIRLN